MERLTPPALPVVVLAIALLGAAAAAGWWLGRPAKIVEPPAPAAAQADGSLILERAPDARAKPKQRVPRNARVERVVAVDVKPAPGALKDDRDSLRVDLSLVRLPDSTRRVLASSPDGEVVGGLDIPVETAAPAPAPKKWAAGLSWSPTHHTAGVWVERDIGRARLGAEIAQVRPLGLGGGLIDTELRLRAGWTF